MSLVVVYSIWFGYIARLSQVRVFYLPVVVFTCLRGGYRRERGDTALALKKSIK